MKVAKFGGTSLADANQIKKVCNIILADEKRKIVVVSAPGKRFKNDIKMTDLLINCAKNLISTGSCDNELNLVINRFNDICKELAISSDIMDVIKTDLINRTKRKDLSDEMLMDLLKAAGEDNTAKLVASYLISQKINAQYIDPKDAGMILSDDFGEAKVLKTTYENLSNLRNVNKIIIFPGFFGYSLNGEVVTFPRGGSDITGSILAASVDAEIYENFTDVDSVFVADPNIIENPRAVNNLTYREMRELSYAGFSVLQQETLEPVFKKGIPVCIKNTNNINSLGTLISLERGNNGYKVSGIASDKGFCNIFISKYLMNKEIGFGRRLLAIFEDEGISYEHIPSGIDNISVVLRERNLSNISEEKLLNRIKTELKADCVEIEKNLALIMLVGEGMANTIGITAEATNALAHADVNIEIINQGSSEISMIFGVKEKDLERAVKSLYDVFFN